MQSFLRSLPILILLFSAIPLSAQQYEERVRTYDVEHYDIRVRLDEAQRSVDGDVRIHLTPFQGTDSLRFDAVNMDIQDVAITGSADAGMDLNWNSVAFGYDSSTLAVKAPSTVEGCIVRVRYRCIPEKGLYFIQPDASFPDDPRQIWTQGQGEDNRYWFPSFDYPSDKATSELHITVDTALETLSNGRLISRVENSDGTATWHWSLAHPHSSYLVMLAAGKYERFRQIARCEDGEGAIRYVPVESWYYPSDEMHDVRRTFMDTDDMVTFFSRRLGVVYPWNKYAQIPVAHFLYGGMENTTATVMADERLVVDARAALDYDPQPLIAHELAHQWFGDYVTYVDWRNEWLNEGFATFMQQVWTQHRFGDEDFLLQRFDGIRSFLDWTDKTGRLPLLNDSRTSAANTYSKGAAVLHMLRDDMGEDAFWQLLHQWLTDNAYGSVNTESFRALAEEVSGKDYHWFFQQWVYGAGYPEVEITRTVLPGDAGIAITVRQTQDTDANGSYFRFPLRYKVAGAEGVIQVSGAQTLDTIPGGKNVLPVFDPTRLLCGRLHVDYSTEEQLRLLQADIPAPWRVLIAEKLLRAPDALDASGRSVIFGTVKNDPIPAVRKSIATPLADLVRRRLPWSGDLRDLLLSLLQDAYAGVRATALNGLHNFHDPMLLPVFWEMLSDSSYYAEAAAMNGVLSLDSTGSIDIIRARLATESRGDVLAEAALDWVQRYRYTELIEDVRQLAGPGHSAALRAKAFETLVLLRVPGEELLEMLRSQLAEPRAVLRLFAAAALRLFPADMAMPLLRAHIANEDNPRVRAFIHEHFGL
ncbi:HEAT repeat domain-containing protein [bacterium]|nr:HEAT repeat domain-containing protein [bacterium]